MPNDEARKRQELISIFSGKKEEWLPLFRRMLARFARTGEVDLSRSKATITLSPAGSARPTIGVIRITTKGLRIALSLRAENLKSTRLRPTRTKSRRFSHEVLISDPADIDEEFMSWIRAARLRTKKIRSKKKST